MLFKYQLRVEIDLINQSSIFIISIIGNLKKVLIACYMLYSCETFHIIIII